MTHRVGARAVEALYADIVANMQVGVYVWRLEDPHDLRSFRLVASNRAAATFTRVPSEDILGKRMSESFPKLFETGLPEAYREILIEGKERDLGVVAYGDERVPEGWFSVKAFPLPDRCVGAVFENITQKVRAEDALRLSEERLRSLLANLPSVTWTSDSEGRSTYISPSIERIYGFTAEEVVARGESLWFHRIHPDDVDRVRRAYRFLFEGRRMFDVEYRILRKDGTWIWVLDQAIATYERAGRWFADGVFSDITARKLAELRLGAEHAVTRVLAESQDLEEAALGVLRAIGESLGCVVAALWRVRGSPGVLVCEELWRQPDVGSGAFDEVCRATQFVRGAGLPGSVWASLDPQWISDISESENFPRKEMAMHGGLKSGFGFPIQTGGEFFGVMEFFMTVRSSPDASLLNMMAAIGSEIGQFIRRKQAEEALRSSEGEMRAVLDAALDAVVGMDEQGLITSWNSRAEAVFGWTRAEAVGRRLSELIVPPELAERHRIGLERFLRTGEGTMLGRRNELTALRRDRTEFCVELSLAARKQSGAWLFSAFIADITDRKKAEQERARLLESERQARAEAEQALDRLRAIQSITEAALANLALDDLLGALLARLRGALHSDSATVLLLEESTQSLMVRASDGLDVHGEGRPVRIPMNQGISGRVAASGQPTIIDDLDSVEVLSPYFRAHVRSLVAVPLVVEGHVIGVLHAGSSSLRRFTPEDMRLLTMVGDRVAPAIDRARLFEEVREGRTRLRALSHRLVELQETERREIARELHDEIGQLLTGLKLLLESDERRARSGAAAESRPRGTGRKAGARGAARAAGGGGGGPAADDDHVRDQMKGLVNDLMGRVRDLSMDLRPAMLDDLGLVPALLWLFERYQSQSGIKVVFHHAGADGRFPAGIETAAFRITQEALTNAARHAHVSEVKVDLRVDDGRLHLRIDDQGQGFSPEPTGIVRSSGLTGMRERARLLGGSLTVTSAPGAGTNIVTEIPLPSRDRKDG